MADATYQPGIYREHGGNRFVVASSGSADVESGGEIDIEAGGKLEISGTALITTGAKVDLSSGRAWILSDVYTTGAFKGAGGVSSTGPISGSSGNLTAGLAVSSGISGTSGTFTADVAVTSGITALKVVLTSGISGSSGTFSAGLNAAGGIVTTGTLTADQITTTGGVNKAISGGQIYAQTGYIHFVEQLTSGSTTMLGYGVSFVYLATAHALALLAPVAGMQKWISCVSTAAALTVSASGAGADFTTAGSTEISMTTGSVAAPTWIHLMGLNSTRYMVIGQSAGVSIS